MCVQANETPSMKYNSLKVAALIAKICKQNALFYNNTKIQKLLYCCYGCALADLDGRICDEYPRAWQHGPVFPRVFKHISKGGEIILIDHSEITGQPAELIEEVTKSFGIYTATSLSEWTHSPNSPWDIVVNQTPADEGGGLGNFIPDDMIKDYFGRHVVQK